MLALRLVRTRPVQLARLVVSPRANRVEDVVKNVILAHPAAILVVEAARQKVHAVGRRQWKLVSLCVDQVLALGSVQLLRLHFDGPANGRSVVGPVARGKIVPGIVADVVSALGLVDAQELDLAVAVREGDAKVVAVDRAGPVGDAVGVDFATEDADRGGVAVVRGGPDCGRGSMGRGGAVENKEGEGGQARYPKIGVRHKSCCAHCE